MIDVVFLGFGNLGHHLCKGLLKAENVRVRQIFNRNSIKFISPFEKISFTDDISQVVEADVYIIAIPDDAIGPFSADLPFKDRLTVHTSGSVNLDQLSAKNRRGAFYPLQTFSKSKEVDFAKIPICIEAEGREDLELLMTLGKSISENVSEITSKQRERLHLAAVFVNNFVNHLYHIGEQIVEKEDLPIDLLRPLIVETASKIEFLSPKEAQTGPARRNDEKVIAKHLQMLKESSFTEYYRLFTNDILKNHQS